MEFLEIPEPRILHGKQAVKALNEFINELEKNKSKRFTKKQAAALIKIAKGLIESIEAKNDLPAPKTQTPKTVSYQTSTLERLQDFFRNL